ncbi:hypothetical protein Axi01nite_51640 [Actinoplanes xinjiangensis]|nr:hypothetical protein Axi01nite_51640 [Actinoplanes xinjiangensis]
MNRAVIYPRIGAGNRRVGAGSRRIVVGPADACAGEPGRLPVDQAVVAAAGDRTPGAGPQLTPRRGPLHPVAEGTLPVVSGSAGARFRHAPHLHPPV